MTGRRDLTFVRHARTVHNERDLVVGGYDGADQVLNEDVAPLPDLGRFATIFCSPIRRARLTAGLLAPGREILPHDGLRERGLGRWEGRHRGELRERYPDAFLPSGSVRPAFTPPGGELPECFLQRVRGFLADAARVPGPVLAVTHHGVIRAATAVLYGEPIEDSYLRRIAHLGRVDVDLAVVSPS